MIPAAMGNLVIMVSKKTAAVAAPLMPLRYLRYHHRRRKQGLNCQKASKNSTIVKGVAAAAAAAPRNMTFTKQKSDGKTIVNNFYSNAFYFRDDSRNFSKPLAKTSGF
jgi:hypothetical protein